MRLAAALLSLTFIATPAFAQEDVQDAARDRAAVTNATDAAIKAAGSWLAILDAGKYGESWSEGAAALRAVVTQAKWEDGLRAVRAPASPTDGVPHRPRVIFISHGRALPSNGAVPRVTAASTSSQLRTARSTTSGG